MNPPFFQTNTVSTKLTHPFCIAKGDFAASQHYVRKEDANMLDNVTKDNGPPVGLPNAAEITSTHSGVLPLSKKLTASARKA